jgi:hypothetical protein
MTKLTWKQWVWLAFVVVLLFAHILIGTLVAIATAFYWLLEQQRVKPPTPRLSNTREIQLAFQQEMQKVFGEAAGTTIQPITAPAGIIDGAGLLKDMSEGTTLQDALVKPELVSVMKTLMFLLAQCSRLEATKQNVKIFEMLFHVGHPITPTVAAAFKEVVEKLTGSITSGPVFAEVK